MDKRICVCCPDQQCPYPVSIFISSSNVLDNIFVPKNKFSPVLAGNSIEGTTETGKYWPSKKFSSSFF
jgi:hypothetical protein